MHLNDIEARDISCDQLYADIYLSCENADFTGMVSADTLYSSWLHGDDVEVLSSLTVGPDAPVDIQDALFVGADATFYSDVFVGNGSLHVVDTVEADIGEF